ncbi:hypothetical protein F511_14547 [Dorcoceras hygrometricum]|uniref:Uncharacterized protein n=1 Tax=Dorcoceras hygrometricum TaxID=472368 RepID=A0A2Z7A2S4_9LAMI|nr:hypothetical protein F511_14547 [Dorcoceras hygrometricum]
MSIEDASPRPEAEDPWLPEPEELPNTPWYEEKSSGLRSSDVPFIREKGGMSDEFEVVIPGPEERAHRPPRGFHSFYINQLEMGLQFPLPRFIAELCQHIRISPSQLFPNSYNFLLSLAILLRYNNLPLVPYGNPSSHKGWMSRFFFVKRTVWKRDPWKCDMSWRDNINTLTPRTPDRSPNLASFLEVMRGKSYSAPELIREDLLCTFGFSKRGVELVGDLDGRMNRAELETRHEKRAKKKASSTSGSRRKETPKTTREPTPSKNVSEEVPDRPPVITITGESPSGRGSERVPPFDPSKDSLVASPSTVMATRYICNMAPVRYLQVLAGAGDVEVVGHFAANIASAIAWGGEVVKRLTRARRTVRASRQQFDEAMGQHAEVVARLEELEALRARQERVAKAQVEALEIELKAEKEAREALEAELREAANGYPEEEHPASFLDVQQALAEMGDDEEEVEEEELEEQEEGEIGGNAGDNPPS